MEKIKNSQLRVTTNLSKMLKVKCKRCQTELATAKKFMLDPDHKQWNCHNCGCEFVVDCTNVENTKTANYDCKITVTVTDRLGKLEKVSIVYNGDNNEWELGGGIKMKIYPDHKTLFMPKGNKYPTLVQIGNSFYVLALHAELENIKELSSYLDKNDVRLLKEMED